MPKKQQFTPGPLRVKRKGEPGYPFGVLGAPHPVDGGDYAPIAVFVNEADANLFAAAPALYEALLKWEQWFNVIRCTSAGKELLLSPELLAAGVIRPFEPYDAGRAALALVEVPA